MLEQLTSEQLTEWFAYENIEPFGEWREDYRIAQLCALIVNMFSMSNESKHRVTVEDFLLQDQIEKSWIEEEITLPAVPQQSVEEMKQVLLSIAGHQSKVKPINPKRRKK